MSPWQERSTGVGTTNLQLPRPELRTRLPALADKGLREAIRNEINRGVDGRAMSTLIHVFALASIGGAVG